MEVTHSHIDEARKTIGIMLVPDDNNHQQVKIMRQTAMKFGDRVQVGFIRSHDVFSTHNITIMRSLRYSLPAITITEKEYTHIMTPILASVLGKMKIVPTIKRDVIYDLLHLQGMGLKKLYTLLKATHLMLMTQFLRN